MRRLLSASLALLATGALWAQNPIIRTSYTPDPAPYAHGDKLYLVWGVMDSEDGTNRLYNIYEYTWTAGPDVVWTYNPPMY